jgi:undecaprenyl diphosphate synthase
VGEEPVLPRVAGHQRGKKQCVRSVRACGERGVEFLTLFAFSSENWRRPADEVSVLKQLFRGALEQEVSKLHEVGIRLRVIGNLAPFGETIAGLVRRAEEVTSANRRLTLTIAANYGGRWDLLQAINAMVREHPERAGSYTERLTPYLAAELRAGTGSLHPHRRRATHLELLVWRLAYELYHRHPVAGLRRGASMPPSPLPPARAAVRRTSGSATAGSRGQQAVDLPDARRKLA